MSELLSFVADLAITGGPVGAAILLIYVAHDKLNARCQEAATGGSATARKRFYDRLYAAFWGFVALLLATGSGVWIFQTLLPAPGEGMIVRGVFTRVPVETEIESEAGRFFVHRQIHPNLVSADVEWVLSSLSGETRPTSATFLITGGDEEEELEAQCTLNFVEAKVSGSRKFEIRFIAEDRALKLLDTGAVFPCETDIVNLSAPDLTGTARNFGKLLAAFAADNIRTKALKDALNSDKAAVRRGARVYLVEKFDENPDIVYAPLLDPDASYREKLGALWAISRLDRMPRQNMFESRPFSDEIWQAVLVAAVSEDKATRDAGRRFIITYPSEETLARLNGFGGTIGEDEERAGRYRSLVAFFHYNRGVYITLAHQNSWVAPSMETALNEIDLAIAIHRELGQVDSYEYAKSLYGRGWLLAVGPKYGAGESFTEDAAVIAFKSFLNAPGASRYPAQIEKATSYIQSPSAKIF